MIWALNFHQVNHVIAINSPIFVIQFDQVSGRLSKFSKENPVSSGVISSFANPMTFNDLQHSILGHHDKDVAINVDGSR